MRKAVRPILEVLIGVVCLETALGILSPTISLQLAHRHEPAELIGLIGSAYFGGFLLGTLTCHRVIDRVGHIRSFSVFAAIATTATLLFLIFDQISVWVILRVIAGYAIAGQYVVIESWLNDKASNENRGRIFSIYMMVSWAASGVSPLALNLADPTGHLLLTMAAIALVLSMIPLALTSTKGWIRRLGGKRWQALHRLIYFSATAGVIHYIWLVKADLHKPLEYAAVLAILLAYRLVAWLGLRASDRSPVKTAAKFEASKI